MAAATISLAFSRVWRAGSNVLPECFGGRDYVLHVAANGPGGAAARVVALWMVHRADACWQLLRNCYLADVDAASYLSFQQLES